MAQGTRGKVAIHVFGLFLCSTLVGCMDNDKKPLLGKSSGQLPGTPMLNNGTSQNRPMNGQQPNFMLDGRPVSNNTNGLAQPGMNGTNNGIQPVGGLSNTGGVRNANGVINTPAIPGQNPYQQPQQPYIPNVGPTSMNVPVVNTNATAYRGQVDPQQLAMTDFPSPPPARAGNVPSVEPNPLAPVAPPMPGANVGIPVVPGTK